MRSPRLRDFVRRTTAGGRRWLRQGAVAFALLLPLTAPADPEGDLRNAVSALAGTSYAWETTGRQRFSGATTDPHPNLNGPIDVRGKTDARQYTEITVSPSRELAAPVAIVFRGGDVVGLTPLGWLRRSEIRSTPGQDRNVDFGGKPVRLSRVMAEVLRATSRRVPTEELFDLLADMKSCRSQDGLILAELHDRTVEQLWGDAQAKRAPEIQGTAIFKLTDAGLAEYHLVLAIGFPNSRTGKVAWSMQQWGTRFSGVGSTVVDPPEAAVKALQD